MSDTVPHAPSTSAPMIVANFTLELGDASISASVPVPTGPTTPRDLLPILQGFTEQLVSVGVNRVTDEGMAISCTAGCGACCRQLVPLAPAEAHKLAAVVSALPEPRRTEILTRFDNAKRRFDEVGMLQIMAKCSLEDPEEMLEFTLKYFETNVPCPFLEAESCSIYADRPLRCREFLVTSPAERCSDPRNNLFSTVLIPGKPALSLLKLNSDNRPNGIRWVPLILALDYAQQIAEDQPRPGTELFREFVEHLAKSSQIARPENPDPE